MPLARIEIEQIEASRWVAEVEAGGRPDGPPFRRQTVIGQSFPAIVEAVATAYFAQVPGDRPAPDPEPALVATTKFDRPQQPETPPRKAR